MTPEQIANFRKALATLVGPWAFMMPESEVQKARDALQKKIDDLDFRKTDTKQTLKQTT
jgi:hypothetical protein